MTSSKQTELESYLLGAVYLSETCFNASRRIYDFIQKQTPSNPIEEMSYNNQEGTTLLKFIGNLLFEKTILELYGLLETRRNTRNFPAFLKLNGTDNNSPESLEIKAIRISLSPVLKIRSDFIAHKNQEGAGGIEGLFFLTFRSDYLTNCETALSRLIAFCKQYFSHYLANNYLAPKLEPKIEHLCLMIGRYDKNYLSRSTLR